MRDPAGLLRRGFELFGPVFAIRIGRGHAAVLIGPEKHRFFFQESDRKLSVTEAYRWMIPIVGAMFPLTVRPEVHRRYHRGTYAAPFTVEKIALYLEPMSRSVLSWLDSLKNEGEFELISTIERIAPTLWSALSSAAARRRGWFQALRT
jgi:sterol 14alpha-demethylase